MKKQKTKDINILENKKVNPQWTWEPGRISKRQIWREQSWKRKQKPKENTREKAINTGSPPTALCTQRWRMLGPDGALGEDMEEWSRCRYSQAVGLLHSNENSDWALGWVNEQSSRQLQCPGGSCCPGEDWPSKRPATSHTQPLPHSTKHWLFSKAAAQTEMANSTTEMTDSPLPTRAQT